MDKSLDKEKSAEMVLDKVTPDRRRFVRSLLGLSVYATPVVTSFIMTSAAIEPTPANAMWT